MELRCFECSLPVAKLVVVREMQRKTEMDKHHTCIMQEEHRKRLRAKVTAYSPRGGIALKAQRLFLLEWVPSSQASVCPHRGVRASGY